MIGTDAILSVISAAVTPVVLVSACGTLTISVNTRQQHLSDLVRANSSESRSEKVSDERRSQLSEQLRLLVRRFALTSFAATSLYGAIACFLATTLVIAASGRAPSARFSAPALALFIFGLSLTVGAAVATVLEVALSRHTMTIELRDLGLPLRKPSRKRSAKPYLPSETLPAAADSD